MVVNVKILTEYFILQVELWLASQEVTSSRLRSNRKETTSEEVPKQIAKENVEAFNGSYLNNSECISSTTSQEKEASHGLNHVGPSCSTEAEVSSTTSTHKHISCVNEFITIMLGVIHRCIHYTHAQFAGCRSL